MLKLCPICKIEKPLIEFNSQKKYCKICHNEKNKLWRETNREKNRNIGNRYQRIKLKTIKVKEIKFVLCSNCNKTTDKTPEMAMKNESGRVFCNSSCAAIFNNSKRKRALKEIKSNYRRRALEKHGCKCSLCDYSNELILEVHHIDRNRNNNVLNNLEVLCPTHHKEKHLLP